MLIAEAFGYVPFYGMALSTHSGGAADKAGSIHEGFWGVRALLFVLDGNASAMRIETPGDDGAEFYLQRGDVREHWQAKRQVTGQDTWSFRRLKTEGVFSFFFEKVRLGDRCVFASISDAPELGKLVENAKASSSLVEFKEHFCDKERRDHFNDLHKRLDGATEADVYSFLRAITVHGGREITMEDLLGYALGAMFQGPWRTTMAVLRDLYLRSTHETLTAPDIEQYLEAHGITRRRAGAPDARERILAATNTYVAGQRAKLIRRTPIRRAVADEVISNIQRGAGPLDILITSAAGGGKSACLCQIVEGLQAASIPVLAFRLDRIEPVSTAILLGEKLGLSESPALVVADTFPGQTVAIVIDQLDCVSTTSGRHPDFFDTVAALRDEVFGLRGRCRIYLVLACRKFDFEHDHRLKRLTATDNPPKQLSEFSNEEVNAVIELEGGDFRRLTPEQQVMLRLPQNLSLFVDAGLAPKDNHFTTTKELCDEYWSAKRKAVAENRPEFAQHWMPVIQCLSASLSERQELSVPKTVMDDFPPEFLDRMASEGVFTWDGKRYGFGHETFFDYCFARTQPNSGRDFVHFLEGDSQHLFRRAQLRQVLGFLRDDNFQAYLEAVNSLLVSENIRPHLKLLSVELIGMYPVPRDEELALLMPWIDSELRCLREAKSNPERLSTRIWNTFFASRTLFPAADRIGLVKQWIHSGEEWLENVMCRYLTWQTDTHSARIAELLKPFVGKEGEWRNRLRYIVNGRHVAHSRPFFDLFLRLVDDGTLDDSKDLASPESYLWSTLYGFGTERPEWCAEFAAHWIDRTISLCAERQADWRYPRLDCQVRGEELLSSAQGNPLVFLQYVLPAVLRIAAAFPYRDGEREFTRDQLWPNRTFDEEFPRSQAYLRACESALQLVGESSPSDVRPFIEQLRPHRLNTANRLLMHAYMSCAAFADEALQLFIDEPGRMDSDLADDSYWFARKVIEKCSPYCSDSVFNALEAMVLAFVPPWERTKEGMRWRGYIAYNLTSALTPSRLSKSGIARLAEWTDRFKKPSGAPRGCHSCTVESPISKESAQHMTDEHWLSAIEVYDNARGEYNSKHPERGGASSLAGVLNHFVKEQPERFARLAMRIPANSEGSYFMQILYGLRGAAIPEELKSAVVVRIVGMNHECCLHAALDLLRDIPNLPDDAIEFIKRMAVYPSPKDEVVDGERDSKPDSIYSCGINSIRGRVAELLRDLVSARPENLAVFLPTIEVMVDDPTLAVRSCVAKTLCAVTGCDIPLAIKLMDRLLEPDDRLLATPHVSHFIRWGIARHFDHYSPVVERMLNSAHDSVRKAGGTMACLARLHHERADALAEKALTGDRQTRIGASAVAHQNLVAPTCRNWCGVALSRLFFDEDQEVRKDAAKCFWHHWTSPEIPLNDYDGLIAKFIESPAFVDDPSYLLHAMEETKRQVPEAILTVCEMFTIRCGEAARDMRTSLSGDEMTVGKLVFTAYAQLKGNVNQKRALDVIDEMSLEGLSSASKHLSEFER